MTFRLPTVFLAFLLCATEQATSQSLQLMHFLASAIMKELVDSFKYFTPF